MQNRGIFCAESTVVGGWCGDYNANFSIVGRVVLLHRGEGRPIRAKSGRFTPRTLASLEQATAHRSQLERELQQLSSSPQLVTRVNDAAAAAVEDVRQLQSKAQDAILQVEEVCRERVAALSQIGGLMRAAAGAGGPTDTY